MDYKLYRKGTLDVLEREKDMIGYEMLHDLKKIPGVEDGVCFPGRKIKAQRTVRIGEAWRHGNVHYIVCLHYGLFGLHEERNHSGIRNVNIICVAMKHHVSKSKPRFSA